MPRLFRRAEFLFSRALPNGLAALILQVRQPWLRLLVSDQVPNNLLNTKLPRLLKKRSMELEHVAVI